MDYRLMHKNVAVMEFTLDDVTCSIIKLGNVFCSEHLPVGIPVKKGRPDRGALNDWWRGRAIPASRQGIRDALLELNVPVTESLLDKCLGLSLSDQYWICPSNLTLHWSDVNFFENEFSDDVGNILFGYGSSGDHISLMSPDNTSDGWLRKKWTIINGKRCLIKGGSGATQQEPYNEVFAHQLMERLGILHVPYELKMIEQYPYCLCEDFITPETELVSAWNIMRTHKKANHISFYDHYLSCCDAFEIKGGREALDRMIVVDYLIFNEDRHLNNFGLVRDADTLEWLGPAPVFDSGTSLWFSTPAGMIHGNDTRPVCKPFKTVHDEQLGLVTSFDWLDLRALKGLGEIFRELVHGSPFVDENRASAIKKAIEIRVDRLKAYLEKRNLFQGISDDSFDVKSDVAYSESGGYTKK